MLGRCISSFFPASPEPISRSVRQNRFKSVAGLVGSLGTKQNDKSEVIKEKHYGIIWQKQKEREKEYMNRLDVSLCLKENFELIIDDVFTIMGVGTVATGNISTGMCREGENACVYKTNGGVLETIITTIDIHTKERKSNGCGYKTEHVGLGLRGVSKEQLEKGDRVIVKNANMYGM